MSLLYRAIWQDWRDDLLAATEDHVAHWLAEKHEIPLVDAAKSDVCRVRLATAEHHGVEATEVTIHETGETDQITSVVRTIRRAEKDHGWVWVDVARESTDFYFRRQMHAPRFVRSLIEAGVESGRPPKSGGVDLATRSLAIASDRVNALRALIEHEQRGLPIVVLSERVGDEFHRGRVDRTAASLAGIARVVALNGDATDAFKDAIGEEMAVWGGALRIYLPGGGPPSRHRYVPWNLLRHSRDLAADQVLSVLGPFVTARSAPPEYAIVRTRLAGRDAGIDELLEVAELELAEKERELAEKDQELKEKQEEILDLLGDNEELTGRIAALQQNFQLVTNAASDDDRVAGPAPVVFDEIDSMQDAVEQARLHLSAGIVIAEAASEKLDECDTMVNSTAWGRHTFNVLWALHDYSLDDWDGSFWDWCARSGKSLWPATSKKLAMKESESVMANPKLRAMRRLPIDSAVCVGERVLMEAHIKIAEGGGAMAPRIYFYDDTSGVTGKVHVGFIGPHKYMENKSTN